jgi:osmoprotectant transport system permease protein
VTPLAQVPFPNWAWLQNPRTWERLAEAARTHVELTLLGVAVGLLIAAPLAVAAVRRPRLRAPLLALAGVLYTIPSIALLVFLAALAGFGRTPVVIGLALYAVLILLRNNIAALESVPADVREAGQAMGYTPRQLLVHVEVPVSLPVVIAGLRIALVSTIGLATIAAFVGQPTLGSTLLTGLQRLDVTIVGVSVIAITLLAVAGDLLLLGAQRLLLPWAEDRR